VESIRRQQKVGKRGHVTAVAPVLLKRLGYGSRDEFIADVDPASP
jgi:hypothetical protein